MDLESVEIVNSHEDRGGKSCGDASLPRLKIHLSHSSDSSKTRRTKHFSVLDTSGVPSLEASITTTSTSSLLDEPSVSSRHNKPTNKPQQAFEAQCPVDEGCMTDRVVRFFCPFETLCPSQTDFSFKPQHQRAFDDNWAVCNDSVPPTANQDCSGGSWVCVPDKWEGSPERPCRDKSKQNIRNRCSTLRANRRKSDYIKNIRNQWHGRDCPVPLRSSRSEAAKYHQEPPRIAKLSAVPSAYYDSDPEIETTTPRYKKKRPQGLKLESNDQYDSDLECPEVPRHTTHKLRSFFDSPRSVTETPDLTNDEEVKVFIQVASEQKYSLVWHQAPRCTGNDAKGQHAQPPPVSVTGWFEHGSQLDNHIVFPKFVWRQTFQEGFKSISKVPNFIQLLTIICVVTPASLDRSLYPYARLDRSCCIRTHDGQELVFEASSKQARDLFVKRMKVLVARLASSVIVHDEGMLQEFFTPMGTESYADYDDEDDISVDCPDLENRNMLENTAS